MTSLLDMRKAIAALEFRLDGDSALSQPPNYHVIGVLPFTDTIEDLVIVYENTGCGTFRMALEVITSDPFIPPAIDEILGHVVWCWDDYMENGRRDQ